jgi:small redox-active disulfide protein 2
MNIKILGTGCTRCQQLEKATKEAIKELGIETGVEKVRDMNKILEYPILTTPGLVVNEKLVSSGKVLSKEEVAGFLNAALAAD